MFSQRPDRVKRAPCKDPAPPRFIFRSISAEATVTTSRQSSQSKTGALSESELLTFREGKSKGQKSTQSRLLHSNEKSLQSALEKIAE